MKRIAIGVVLFFGAAAWAQVGIPPGVIYGNPTPGGACVPGAGQIIASTGIIYTCPVTLVWTALGTGSGSVTAFSAGTLSPLFTTSVANSTTTPALSFSLSNAAQNTVLAGPTSGTGAPTYRALVAADIPFPTATAAGQIISSTAAGTTYGVQPNVFYQQSGDTIASIEAECSTGCIYHVTGGQTITLAASHTLNSNVYLSFDNSSALWTVNGAFTLTIPGIINASPIAQIFAGTSTVIVQNQNTYWQWWGAVNDGVYGGLGSVTGVSGGSGFSGSGTIFLTNFSNNCSGSTATVTLAAGVFSSAVVTAAGSGCTAIPSTATCTSGTATCTGSPVTITVTTTNAASGTDNTTAINAARAGTQTGYCFEPGAIGFYLVTGPIAIVSTGSRCIGDPKMRQSNLDGLTTTAGKTAVLLNTSTTANTITVTGASNSYMDSPVVQNLGIAYPNLVSSGGTATGVYDQYTQHILINNVAVLDPIIGFHHFGASNGHVHGNVTAWGYGVVTGYTNSFTGLIDQDVDTSSTTASASLELFDNAVAVNGAVQSNGQIVTGISETGNAMNDQQIDYYNANSAQNPIAFTYTGGGGGIAANDIHIFHSTLQCGSSGTKVGILFSGLPASQKAQVTVADVWIGGCTTAANVSNSFGIQMMAIQSDTNTTGVSFTTNSTGNSVDMNCISATTCVTADSSTTSFNTCNVLVGSSVTNITNSAIACSSRGTTVTTAANVPGITDLTSGQAGANSIGRFYNSGTGRSLPAGCFQVIGQQLHCGMNLYYNGTNWVNISGTSNPSGSMYFAYQDTSNAFFGISLPPAGTGTISTIGTTAVSLICKTGNHCMFNPGGQTPTQGTVAIVSVNPNNTTDNLATVQINSAATGNKGLVVQGFSGQTANLQEWQNNSGTPLASVSSSGGQKAVTYSTGTNCSSGASPAACGSAAAGAVAMPTGTNPTLVINTTAVTANSEILLTVDDSLTIAATTCNSTLATLVGGMAVTARTAATSFTVSYNGTVAVNPVCFSYSIIN